jgi:hypothetical protein
METGRNLAESSKEGYGRKGAVLSMMMMLMMEEEKKENFPRKYRFTFNGLHGVASLKTKSSYTLPREPQILKN